MRPRTIVHATILNQANRKSNIIQQSESYPGDTTAFKRRNQERDVREPEASRILLAA